MKTEYAVRYYVDEDGGWNAEVPDLPGCFTCGDTEEEVRANVREAIEAMLESYRKHGQAVPEARTRAVEIVSVDIPA